jgi:uncharacterized membrane protein YgdD (TMEM256/DUF423 family)
MIVQVSSAPGARVLAAAGAVLAAAGVALAAYAAHAAAGLDQGRLLHAALFGFGHGIALVALAPQASRRLGRLALVLMLAGVLLFSGSLVAAVFFGTSTGLAPAGGSLMILAWLLYAADALRR